MLDKSLAIPKPSIQADISGSIDIPDIHHAKKKKKKKKGKKSLQNDLDELSNQL